MWDNQQKFDEIDRETKEMSLRTEDYTGLYFAPGFIIGILFGVALGLKICEGLTKYLFG